MFVKNVSEQKNTAETNLKEYCANIMDLAKQEMQSQISEFERNIENIKVGNGKYHMEAMNKVKDTKEKLELFHQEKEVLIREFEEQKRLLNENNEVFESMSNQFNVTEKTDSQIIEMIKVNNSS